MIPAQFAGIPAVLHIIFRTLSNIHISKPSLIQNPGIFRTQAHIEHNAHSEPDKRL